MKPKVKQFYDRTGKDGADPYEGFTPEDYQDLLEYHYDFKTKKKKLPVPAQALIYWSKKANPIKEIFEKENKS